MLRVIRQICISLDLDVLINIPVSLNSVRRDFPFTIIRSHSHTCTWGFVLSFSCFCCSRKGDEEQYSWHWARRPLQIDPCFIDWGQEACLVKHFAYFACTSLQYVPVMKDPFKFGAISTWYKNQMKFHLFVQCNRHSLSNHILPQTAIGHSACFTVTEHQPIPPTMNH